MTNRNCFQTGAIFALLSVLLGAFGAHGLSGLLDESHRETFDTGVRYQFYHASALFTLGFLISQNRGLKWLRYAAYWFIAGIILFSGSLYALAFNQIISIPAWVGPVTPIGGICFILGWGCVFISQFRLSDDARDKHPDA